MLVKMGVYYDKASRNMRRAWPIIDEAFIEITGQEAVMTSNNEGDHSPGSLHYDTSDYGANDFRLKHLSLKIRDDIRVLVKEKLAHKFGRFKYDVVFSKGDTVLHVEYDPR